MAGAFDTVSLLASVAAEERTSAALSLVVAQLRHDLDQVGAQLRSDLDQVFGRHEAAIQCCMSEVLSRELCRSNGSCLRCGAAGHSASPSRSPTNVVDESTVSNGPKAVREKSFQLEGLTGLANADTKNGAIDGKREEFFPIEGDEGADGGKLCEKAKVVEPPNHGSHKICKKSSTKHVDVSGFSGCRKRIAQVITTKPFEIAVILAIVANSIMLGVVVQINAKNHVSTSEADLPIARVFEILFLMFFTFELCARIYVFRSRFFIQAEDRAWNIFDTLVVSTSLFDQLLSAISTAEFPSQLSILRMLRMVRVVRMLRVIRVVRFFRDLRLMIMSILGSAKALLWVTVILFLTFYLFGIALTEGTVDYLSENDLWHEEDTETLRSMFSSVDITIVSLLAAMTGGISWGEHYEELQVLPWVYNLIFLVFVVFEILAVLNIVTAVFVDAAMEAAVENKDMLAQDKLDAKADMLKELHEAFIAMDTDGSGKVSIDEMETAFDHEDVAAMFQELDIAKEDTRRLFDLIDLDGEGTISVDEFIEGLSRIKGPMNSLDFATVLYGVRWLKSQVMYSEAKGLSRLKKT